MALVCCRCGDFVGIALGFLGFCAIVGCACGCCCGLFICFGWYAGFVCFLVREFVGWRNIVLVYLMDVGLLRIC